MIRENLGAGGPLYPPGVIFTAEGIQPMNRDAWIELPHYRYDRVWDRFDAAFQFNPSPYEWDWPTFLEPAPSVTWDISDVLAEFYPWKDPRATPYNLALLRALLRCVPEDEPVLALDWQHASYEFYPHRFRGADDPASWCIPALPSGEYHLFVTEDHRLGSLGHPWAQTLCIFGERFVEEYLLHTPVRPAKIIRQQAASHGETGDRQPKRKKGQRCPRRRPGKGGRS
jgi:hypothetical protein